MPDEFERLRIARDSFKDLAHANFIAADRLAAENARLHSDLTAAREERDRARALTRDLHRRTQKAERFRDRWKSWPWMFEKRMLEARRRRRAEDNLIALAKMYGEACGELHRARMSADEGWDMAAKNQDAELVDYARAEAAQTEASKLRADLHESSMQHIARDVADEQAWGEIAGLRERVAKLEEGLRECLNQLEYQDEKFGGTGSGDTVMHRTRSILEGRP